MSDQSEKDQIEKVISQNFKLEDIVPEDQQIRIGGKEYTLRKITLEDEVWLKQYGNINALMQKEDVAFMSRLTFRLLVDKSDFLPVKEKGFDDDGNEVEIQVTGPQKILRSLSGPSARFEWVRTLMATFGISRPMFDQMIEDALKKNEIAQSNPVGEKSLT